MEGSEMCVLRGAELCREDINKDLKVLCPLGKVLGQVLNRGIEDPDHVR